MTRARFALHKNSIGLLVAVPMAINTIVPCEWEDQHMAASSDHRRCEPDWILLQHSLSASYAPLNRLRDSSSVSRADMMVRMYTAACASHTPG